MKPALIIGNGVSRKGVNLNETSKGHVTFGCNALYRVFKPDWLYAIDDVIISEIIQSDFPMDRFIVPPIEEQYEPVEYNPARPRENAGMVAMRDAIRKGHNHLNCIGMDFLIHDESFNVANLFDGTNGYGANTRANFHDCMARAKYFDWFVSQNPTVKFYAFFPQDVVEKQSFRVAPKDNFTYLYF